MTKEAKLGLFVLLVLAVFLFFTINMGALFFKRGERVFHIYFDNIGTLDVGAPVKQAGYDVGEVHAISLQTIAEPTPTTYIVVQVRVSDDALISVDSRASLQTLGMMGEKYIEITFGKGNPATRETRLVGEGPYEIDRVIKNAVDLSNEVMVTVQSLNKIFADPELPKNINHLIANLEQVSLNLNLVIGGHQENITILVQNSVAASEHLRSMIATAELFITDLQNLTHRNAGRIDQTLDNVAAISQDARDNLMADIKTTTAQLKEFTRKLDDSVESANRMMVRLESLVDRQTPEVERAITNIGDISDNARQTSVRINEMLNQREGLVHDLFYDPELAQAAKETIIQASGVVKSINTIPNRLTFNAEFSYFTENPRFDPDDNAFRADLGLQFDLNDDFYLYAGGNNLGTANQLEAQLGYHWGPLTLHGGMIESELGAGVDWQIMDRLMFGVEGVGLSDRHKERLDAYTQYRLWEQMYLFGGAQDITDDVFPNAGIRVRF